MGTRTHVDACDLRMLFGADSRNSLSVAAEPGALNYTKHAMHIRKANADADAATRARPKHVDRRANASGVQGVHSAGTSVPGYQCVVARFENAGGTHAAKTVIFPKDDPASTTQSVGKRL